MATFSVLTVFVVLRFLFLLLGPVSLVEGAPKPQGVTSNSTAPSSSSAASGYWLASIQRQGTVAFGGGSGYQIFRNVRDFGAKGELDP